MQGEIDRHCGGSCRRIAHSARSSNPSPDSIITPLVNAAEGGGKGSLGPVDEVDKRATHRAPDILFGNRLFHNLMAVIYFVLVVPYRYHEVHRGTYSVLRRRQRLVRCFCCSRSPNCCGQVPSLRQLGRSVSRGD